MDSRYYRQYHRHADELVTTLCLPLPQAVMMDALISTFVDELKRRAAQYPDDLEGHMLDHGTEVDGEWAAVEVFCLALYCSVDGWMV